MPGTKSEKDIGEGELQLVSSAESYEKSKSSHWISWVYKVDSLGIETRGIERVTPEERELLSQKKKHSKIRQFLNVLGLWVAACGGLTSCHPFFYQHYYFT